MKQLPKEKQDIAEEVKSRQERFWKISDDIWSFAEPGLEEYRSSALLADSLEEDGFKVKRGVAGMPTAFVGTWKNGNNGPVIGSPAEELLVSRPYMIRAGLFQEVAAVIDCHSADWFGAHYGVEGLGMCSFTVAFRGKTSHAGSSPWMGRSAADAVELMHAATERMREHLPITQRSHWVTLEGGDAPNVVPSFCRTWYFVKDCDDNLEHNFNWVLDCARGAALMTRTTHEVRVLAAVHQRYSNRELAQLMYKNIRAVGKTKYTDAEREFATALQKSADLPEKGLQYDMILESPKTFPMSAGSSDVGDVSLVVPTATLRFPVRVPGCQSHHWTTTASSITSIAHKGITAGAKAAAFTVYDLLSRPDVLKAVRDEFDHLLKECPYRSLLPEDARPPFGWNTAFMENKGHQWKNYE